MRSADGVFQIVQVASLNSKRLAQVYAFCTEAVEKDQTGILAAGDIFHHLKNCTGFGFVVLKNGDAIAGGFFVIEEGNGKKCLNILFLAGEKIKEWRDLFEYYYIYIANLNKCDSVICLGRRGFGKIFPRAKQVAVLLEIKINEKSNKEY